MTFRKIDDILCVIERHADSANFPIDDCPLYLQTTELVTSWEFSEKLPNFQQKAEIFYKLKRLCELVCPGYDLMKFYLSK